MSRFGKLISLDPGECTDLFEVKRLNACSIYPPILSSSGKATMTASHRSLRWSKPGRTKEKSGGTPFTTTTERREKSNRDREISKLVKLCTTIYLLLYWISLGGHAPIPEPRLFLLTCVLVAPNSDENDGQCNMIENADYYATMTVV